MHGFDSNLYIASFSSTSLPNLLDPELCNESANGMPETSSYFVIIQGHRNLGGGNERLDQRARLYIGGRTGTEEEGNSCRNRLI